MDNEGSEHQKSSCESEFEECYEDHSSDSRGVTIGEFIKRMNEINFEYFDFNQMLRMGNKVEHLIEI